MFAKTDALLSKLCHSSRLEETLRVIEGQMSLQFFFVETGAPWFLNEFAHCVSPYTKLKGNFR